VPVDIGVENRTVVFAGGDERDRFAAEEEVVGIFRMQTDRLQLGNSWVGLRLRGY
jgi:hypothetical protein